MVFLLILLGRNFAIERTANQIEIAVFKIKS